MTVSSTVDLAASAAPSAHRLHSRLLHAALAVVVFALLTGAWLAFFMFVPLDFTSIRPR